MSKPRRTLTRDEWTALGVKVKQGRRLLFAIAATVGKDVGQKAAGPWGRMIQRLDSAKSPLDSLACNQHPDWWEAPSVFYGGITTAEGSPSLPDPEPDTIEPDTIEPFETKTASGARKVPRGRSVVRVGQADNLTSNSPSEVHHER